MPKDNKILLLETKHQEDNKNQDPNSKESPRCRTSDSVHSNVNEEFNSFQKAYENPENPVTIEDNCVKMFEPNNEIKGSRFSLVTMKKQ